MKKTNTQIPPLAIVTGLLFMVLSAPNFQTVAITRQWAPLVAAIAYIAIGITIISRGSPKKPLIASLLLLPLVAFRISGLISLLDMPDNYRYFSIMLWQMFTSVAFIIWIANLTTAVKSPVASVRLRNNWFLPGLFFVMPLIMEFFVPTAVTTPLSTLVTIANALAFFLAGKWLLNMVEQKSGTTTRPVAPKTTFTPPVPRASTDPSTTVRLKNYKDLLDAGMISKSEYEDMCREAKNR